MLDCLLVRRDFVPLSDPFLAGFLVTDLAAPLVFLVGFSLGDLTDF